MPLTLPDDPYAAVMLSKGFADADARAPVPHAQLPRGLRRNERRGRAPDARVRPIDTATAYCWWDYGLLALYRKNNLLAAQDSPEAAALRAFLRIPVRDAGTALAHGASLQLACRIGVGSTWVRRAEH
jgi:hypothetical protein